MLTYTNREGPASGAKAGKIEKSYHEKVDLRKKV